MGNLLSAQIRKQLAIPGYAPNLFEIDFYTTETGERDTDVPDTTLYCTGYTITSPTMEIKQNILTKQHYIEKYTVTERATITWQEDSDLSVWRYHRNWLNAFYNRGKDLYIVGPANKKRNAIIRLQKYKDVELATLTMNDEPLRTNYEIQLYGLIPTTLPELKGDWGADVQSGSSGITITYFIDYINIARASDDEGNTTINEGAI